MSILTGYEYSDKIKFKGTFCIKPRPAYPPQ